MTIRIEIKHDTPGKSVPVYLRVWAKRKSVYLHTGYKVSWKEREGRRITNKRLLSELNAVAAEAERTVSRVAGFKLRNMSARQIADIILERTTPLPTFSEYARGRIEKLRETGVAGWRNYRCALYSLEGYADTDAVTFEALNRRLIIGWIESLLPTKHAKQSYPGMVSTLYKDAQIELNPTTGSEIIPPNPFKLIRFPRGDTAPKRSISIEDLRAFVSLASAPAEGRARRAAYDAVLLVFYLAGINIGDLYHLKASDYRCGKICYTRRKTAKRKGLKAYREITVPPEASEVFRRLRKGARGGSLLCLSACWSTSVSAGRRISAYCMELTEARGLPRVTSYVMRHTWATIARNDVRASMEDVAFALCHGSGYDITDGYIRPRYDVIDELNAKVIACLKSAPLAGE